MAISCFLLKKIGFFFAFEKSGQYICGETKVKSYTDGKV